MLCPSHEKVTATENCYQEWGHCCGRCDHVVFSLLEVVCGGLWKDLELWTREALQCCGWSLIRHSGESLKDKRTEGGVGYGSLACGLSEEKDSVRRS